MPSTSEPARIGFICAMPMELRPLARILSLHRSDAGEGAILSGSLGQHEVFATVTGMGTKLATENTNRLLDAVSIDHVAVVGITGALENSTPIGTLVLPEVVVDGATGIEHRPAPLGGSTPAGKMWTGDELLTDEGVLASLREQGVVALDMETAAIADACERRGIPWAVFRAISDRASDGSLDEEILRLSNQDGTPNARAALRYLMRHPSRIPSLMRLAKGARLAAETAAHAAVRACSAEWRDTVGPA